MTTKNYIVSFIFFSNLPQQNIVVDLHVKILQKRSFWARIKLNKKKLNPLNNVAYYNIHSPCGYTAVNKNRYTKHCFYKNVKHHIYFFVKI